MPLFSSLVLPVLLVTSAATASAQSITINSFGQSDANPSYTAPTAGALTNTVATFFGSA